MAWIPFAMRPWHDDLLDRARRLAEDGEHEFAVVAAQIACELFAEQVFSALLVARGLSEIEEPLAKLVRGFNLSDARTRDLYVALSGVRIQDEPFSTSYKRHVDRRNGTERTPSALGVMV
jgi:hypothetical protein